MRNLTTVLMAAALSAASGLAGAAPLDDVAGGEGVLTSVRKMQVADNSTDPKAMTVGEFMHDYPRGAPDRMRMFPTKNALELTVLKPDGSRVKIVQDAEDSEDLKSGDKVRIEKIDGVDKVVERR